MANVIDLSKFEIDEDLMDVMLDNFPLEFEKDDKIIYQRSGYIEDGCYIVKSKDEQYSLFEIPQYGGFPSMICKNTTINECLEQFLKLN